MDDFTKDYRRTVRDYRLALGLTITHTRDAAGLSLNDAAARTGIPEQTLRSYERGRYHPQVSRLIAIAQAFNVSMFELLNGASTYIYRASGQPLPEQDSTCRDKLCALLLYCGASPDDISTVMLTEDPQDHE
jgi:transcriptional regulator with XRE-family HTH domain